MANEIGRKPDYRLKVMHKGTSLKGDVGCAWRNEDGSLSISLDPFVQLVQDGNLVLTLFENKPYVHKQS